MFDRTYFKVWAAVPGLAIPVSAAIFYLGAVFGAEKIASQAAILVLVGAPLLTCVAGWLPHIMLLLNGAGAASLNKLLLAANCVFPIAALAWLSSIGCLKDCGGAEAGWTIIMMLFFGQLAAIGPAVGAFTETEPKRFPHSRPQERAAPRTETQRLRAALADGLTDRSRKYFRRCLTSGLASFSAALGCALFSGMFASTVNSSPIILKIVTLFMGVAFLVVPFTSLASLAKSLRMLLINTPPKWRNWVIAGAHLPTIAWLFAAWFVCFEATEFPAKRMQVILIMYAPFFLLAGPFAGSRLAR